MDPRFPVLLCRLQLCDLGLVAAPLWALVQWGAKHLPHGAVVPQVEEAQARHGHDAAHS